MLMRTGEEWVGIYIPPTPPARKTYAIQFKYLKQKKRVMISLFSYPHPFFCISQTKLNHPPLPDDYFKNSKISSARP